MTTNYIDGMTDSEIRDECCKILNPSCKNHHFFLSNPYLTGLIIEKLQEWGCDVKIFQGGEVEVFLPLGNTPTCLAGTKSNLNIAFLFTAQVLGHWHPPEPEKVKEPELEYWMKLKDGNVIATEKGNWPQHCVGWQRVSVVPYKEVK